jgi:1,4-alpha-glucan branching enzyme
MNYKGYWCLQLHARRPYVRHPEYPDFLEEDWLYEAITETYLPLLSVFEKFVEDRIDFRITMTITPSLANMLSDNLLQFRYYERLNKQIELSEKELSRTQNSVEFKPVAQMYYDRFQNCKRLWVE